MAATVNIKNGAVYLTAEIAEVYFNGIEAVIVLHRDNAIHVLPVHQMAAGGCFLKQRNAAGDRVASAPDVFEANDLLAFVAEGLSAHWSTKDGALIIPLPEIDM